MGAERTPYATAFRRPIVALTRIYSLSNVHSIGTVIYRRFAAHNVASLLTVRPSTLLVRLSAYDDIEIRYRIERRVVGSSRNQIAQHSSEYWLSNQKEVATIPTLRLYAALSFCALILDKWLREIERCWNFGSMAALSRFLH